MLFMMYNYDHRWTAVLQVAHAEAQDGRVCSRQHERADAVAEVRVPLFDEQLAWKVRHRSLELVEVLSHMVELTLGVTGRCELSIHPRRPGWERASDTSHNIASWVALAQHLCPCGR